MFWWRHSRCFRLVKISTSTSIGQLGEYIFAVTLLTAVTSSDWSISVGRRHETLHRRQNFVHRRTKSIGCDTRGTSSNINFAVRTRYSTEVTRQVDTANRCECGSAVSTQMSTNIALQLGKDISKRPSLQAEVRTKVGSVAVHLSIILIWKQHFCTIAESAPWTFGFGNRAFPASHSMETPRARTAAVPSFGAGRWLGELPDVCGNKLSCRIPKIRWESSPCF
jgi:hypothetical protein